MRTNASTVWRWALSDRAQVHARRFAENHGLFPDMLRALPGACMGALPANTNANDFFEVDPAGDWMIAVASEITLQGEVIDIVCFDPSYPRNLYRYTGNSAWLGFHEVHRRSEPYFDNFIGPVCVDDTITDAPLYLTWDALTWTRAAGTVALPIDRTAFYDLCWLNPTINIICDEKTGAVDLYKFLTRPPADLPQIRIAAEALAGAA